MAFSERNFNGFFQRPNKQLIHIVPRTQQFDDNQYPRGNNVYKIFVLCFHGIDQIHFNWTKTVKLLFFVQTIVSRRHRSQCYGNNKKKPKKIKQNNNLYRHELYKFINNKQRFTVTHCRRTIIELCTYWQTITTITIDCTWFRWSYYENRLTVIIGRKYFRSP